MQFEAPSPQQRSGHDFSTDPLRGKQPITYRAGTLEEASANMYFDGRLPAEYMTHGFEYYDKETQSRVKINSLTAYVLGVYYGSFSNGQGKGDIRYFSNLVADTVKDILQVSYFIDDKRRTLAIGNYKRDIVPALDKEGRKGGYTRVVVAYIAELKEVRAIHLSATSEAGFVKAIAAARGIPEHKASLYGLADLSSEIWVFKYDGESEAVVFSPQDLKNVAATLPAKKGNKKIYFQPILTAGVIRESNEKWAETFRRVSEMQGEYTDYLNSEQAYLRAKATGEDVEQREGYDPNNPTHAAEPFNTQGKATDPGFPTEEVRNYEDNAPEFGEDLPF